MKPEMPVIWTTRMNHRYRVDVIRSLEAGGGKLRIFDLRSANPEQPLMETAVTLMKGGHYLVDHWQEIAMHYIDQRGKANG